MLSQVDWRRVATGSGVLLLHLLVLLALLNVTGIVRLRDLGAPKEIMLTLTPPPRPPQQAPIPQLPDQMPIPFAIAPSTQMPRAITTPPPVKQTTEPQGDIRALGRYLYYCTGAYYEQLSPAERQNCLLFKNNHRDNVPVLGEAKPSQFDQVIKERQAPAISPFQQCDPTSINASLHNVPCFNPSNGHSILEENPGH